MSEPKVLHNICGCEMTEEDASMIRAYHMAIGMFDKTTQSCRLSILVNMLRAIDIELGTIRKQAAERPTDFPAGLESMTLERLVEWSRADRHLDIDVKGSDRPVAPAEPEPEPEMPDTRWGRVH